MSLLSDLFTKKKAKAFHRGCAKKDIEQRLKKYLGKISKNTLFRLDNKEIFNYNSVVTYPLDKIE